MKPDEIVEQVRAAQEKIAARSGYNLGRLFEEMEEAQEKGNREVVSLPARKPVETGTGS